jgi:hypothetical protein
MREKSQQVHKKIPDNSKCYSENKVREWWKGGLCQEVILKLTPSDKDVRIKNTSGRRTHGNGLYGRNRCGIGFDFLFDMVFNCLSYSPMCSQHPA